MTSFNTITAKGGDSVVEVAGRLDMAAAPQFKTQVASTLSGNKRLVVVDLSGVEFMDSSGLGALISGLRTTRQVGSDLRIASAQPQVLAVLELTKIDRILHPYSSVDEALGAG